MYEIERDMKNRNKKRNHEKSYALPFALYKLDRSQVKLMITIKLTRDSGKSDTKRP